MVKYKGHEVEIRMATTESGLGNAPAIPSISSFEYDVEQNVEATPKGMGSRQQEVKEGLIEITGSLEKDYEESLVCGTDPFYKAAQPDATGALTPLYFEVKNITTGKKVILKKVKGKYNCSEDVDGYVTETYDWSAEEIAFA